MEQREQNDSEDWRTGRPIRVEEDVRGTVERDGRTSGYAYHLVYTQESVRVLDMRLVHPMPGLPRHLSRVLRGRLAREGYRDWEIEWEHDVVDALKWKIVEKL